MHAMYIWTHIHKNFKIYACYLSFSQLLDAFQCYRTTPAAGSQQQARRRQCSSNQTEIFPEAILKQLCDGCTILNIIMGQTCMDDVAVSSGSGSCSIVWAVWNINVVKSETYVWYCWLDSFISWCTHIS